MNVKEKMTTVVCRIVPDRVCAVLESMYGPGEGDAFECGSGLGWVAVFPVSTRGVDVKTL